MFTTSLKLAEKYNYLEDKFIKAFTFLKAEDLTSLEEGSYPIVEDEVVAHVQYYITRDVKTLQFETHDQFFDIQYVVKGQEQFGYVQREGLTIATEYDAKNDITFYEEPPKSSSIVLNPGDFVIVAPEDAHKPRGKAEEPSEVKKIVIKVRV